MSIFQVIEQQGEHEQVIFCHNKKVNLKAIIAIHSTILGPALGGIRIWPYASDEQALIDVLRLSKCMTYKAAVSGLKLGGGKSVIIGDPQKIKSEALFRAFGQYIHSLNGRYIAAEDVGTCVEDMKYIHRETPWVAGTAQELGGSGDPSPYTAHGVLMGIKAALKHQYQISHLDGITVAIQGVGHVGSYLATHLYKSGAELIISDINSSLVDQVAQETNAKVVDPKSILFTKCDVLAPCALGGLFDDKTIPQIKAKIIAGGANNQLVEERHGQILHEKGILYAPDFVINAGGLISVFSEFEKHSLQDMQSKQKMYSQKIYNNLIHIFQVSREQNVTTHKAAHQLAIDCIEKIKPLNHFYQNPYLVQTNQI